MASLTEIDGIGPSLEAAFVKSKYLTIANVATAKPVELSIIPGVSVKNARKIIASANSLLANSSFQKFTKKAPVKPVAPLKSRLVSRAKPDSDVGKATKAKKSKNDKHGKKNQPKRKN
jgi:Holliday junction resolvasome RuvABC DNA-binding subunit